MSIREEDITIHPLKQNGFEGWYTRIQSDDISMAVIFGVSSEYDDPHAFIQTLDSMTHTSQYIRFSLMDVSIQKTPFKIQIKQNVMSCYGLRLALHNADISIVGEVTYSKIKPIKATRYAPTAMGPMAYLKAMDCVHSLISMHHDVKGSFDINHQAWNVNGVGYMEKDRGTSFPKQYIWLQGMNDQGDSFVLAVADVPICCGSFQGVLGCILCEGDMMRIGSYYGAKAMVRQEQGYIRITLYQGLTRIYISVRQQYAKALKAPVKGSMRAEIKESLDSTMRIAIYKKGKRSILSFKNCACEVCEALI